MNLKTILLVVGLVAGAAVGWFTAPRPATTEIHAGPLNMTVQKNDNSGGAQVTVNGQNGGLNIEVGNQRSAFDDPGLRTAIFAAIAAIVGLGAGYLLDMRKG
jgi:hypothetical protein